MYLTPGIGIWNFLLAGNWQDIEQSELRVVFKLVKSIPTDSATEQFKFVQALTPPKNMLNFQPSTEFTGFPN